MADPTLVGIDGFGLAAAWAFAELTVFTDCNVGELTFCCFEFGGLTTVLTGCFEAGALAVGGSGDLSYTLFG